MGPGGGELGFQCDARAFHVPARCQTLDSGSSCLVQNNFLTGRESKRAAGRAAQALWLQCLTGASFPASVCVAAWCQILV